jgi:mannose-1-phosphate guanylyltransferase
VVLAGSLFQPPRRLLQGNSGALANLIRGVCLKAFLLAAGHGTRLRPLTYQKPKCLLPVGGKPIIQIWIEKCRQFGIEQVLVNVHAHADMVRDFLGNSNHGVDVQVVEEQKLLGSAGTLLANRKWVNGEGSFWVFYADVLHQANLSAMLRVQESKKPAATLGVYRVPDPTRCGIVDVAEDGTVLEFVEKPQQPRSNLAFSGLMIGTPTLLDVIPRNVPADIGFHVLPQLVGRMMAYTISEYMIDIGTLENYHEAQRSWPGL